MGKNALSPGFQMTIECYPKNRPPPLQCKETDFTLKIKTATSGVEALRNALDNSFSQSSLECTFYLVFTYTVYDEKHAHTDQTNITVYVKK